MIKVIKIFWFLFLISYKVLSQFVDDYESSLKCLKGTWQGENQIKEPFADLSSEYLIFNNNLLLKVNLGESFLSVSRFYFQNITNKPNELARINLDSLKRNKDTRKNFYYTQSTYIDEVFRLKKDVNNNYLYNIAPDFSCQGDELVYFYGEYRKINNIPDNVIKFIVESSKRSRNDSLLNFIDKKVGKITSNKAYLYNSMKEKTNSYVIKDDIVFIEEETNNWIKINFFGTKTIEAWIRRNEVEF